MDKSIFLALLKEKRERISDKINLENRLSPLSAKRMSALEGRRSELNSLIELLEDGTYDEI